MKQVLIKSKTPAGEKALEQHIKEFKKLNFKQRLVFKTAGYSQEVIDDKNILLKIRSHRANNPLFLDLIIGEINQALESNGATVGVDFETEIKEG